MATIAKSGVPSLATVVKDPGAHQITGLLAGEALAAGDLVYVKSDGKIWKTNGTNADAAAKVDGMVLVAAQVGEACSVWFDVTVRYGAGMTPGARVYASTTAGLIDGATSTGGSAPVGFVVDATRIFIGQSHY